VDRKALINGLYVVVAILAIFAIQSWWIESQQVETIPYSQFDQMMDAGKIKSVRVTDKYITGTLKETPPDGRSRFVTVRVEPSLAKQLEERGITVEGAVDNNLIREFCPGFCRCFYSSAYGPFLSAASPRRRAWAAS
jgi:cell division protease FtsH